MKMCTGLTRHLRGTSSLSSMSERSSRRASCSSPDSTAICNPNPTSQCTTIVSGSDRSYRHRSPVFSTNLSNPSQSSIRTAIFVRRLPSQHQLGKLRGQRGRWACDSRLEAGSALTALQHSISCRRIARLWAPLTPLLTQIRDESRQGALLHQSQAAHR